MRVPGDAYLITIVFPYISIEILKLQPVAGFATHVALQPYKFKISSNMQHFKDFVDTVSDILVRRT